MAGVLTGIANFLTPALQVAGPYKQLNDLTAEQDKRKAGTEAGVDAMLSTLGPEYEPFRQARKAGMSAQDVESIIGGPLGSALRDRALQSQQAAIVNNPDLSREEKAAKLAAIGGITGSEYLTATKPNVPKISGTLGALIAERGITPEQYMKMPQPMRDQWQAEADKRTISLAGQKTGAETKERFDTTMAMPIYMFKGTTSFFDNAGRPLPADTPVNVASKTGVAIRNTDVPAYRLTLQTEQGIKALNQAAQQYLPTQKDTEVLGTLTGPAKLAWQTRVFPEQSATAFNSARVAVIDVTRQLANTGRVNQTELDRVTDSLPGPNDTRETAGVKIQQAMDRLAAIKSSMESNPMDTVSPTLGAPSSGGELPPDITWSPSGE